MCIVENFFSPVGRKRSDVEKYEFMGAVDSRQRNKMMACHELTSSGSGVTHPEKKSKNGEKKRQEDGEGGKQRIRRKNTVKPMI